jgi:hypothetical protein
MRRLNAVSLALLVTTLIAGLAGADGLGDAAKRAKTKRDEKKSTEPATVHTNDSVLPEPGETEKPTRGTFSAPPPEAKPPTAPPVPSSPTPPRSGSRGAGSNTPVANVGGGVPPTTGSAEAEPDPDAEKRARAAVLKEELASVNKQLQDALAAMAAAQRELRDAEYHTDQIAADWARGKLQNARAAAEEALRRRDALNDEVRREGIPPGWVR